MLKLCEKNIFLIKYIYWLFIYFNYITLNIFLLLYVKVKIPNDFSGEVVGRKCEWNFPEWELKEKSGTLFLAWPLAGTNLEAEPSDERCKECLLQEVCTRYVVDAALWRPLPDREQFNAKSFSVYTHKALENPGTDITFLRKCSGEYPWEKWEEWRQWDSDAFSIWDPCISCIFHISCAVQALRQIDSAYWIPRDTKEFDKFSKERTLKYLATWR